jgi:hypothetical protein
MMTGDLQEYKLLIKFSLIYQIEQAKHIKENSQNELERKICEIMINGCENLLLQLDDLRSVTKAKQWFRDISAYPIESGDTAYAIYLEEKTGLRVEIFNRVIKQVEKYLKVGKIKWEHQYREVESVFHLYSSQNKPNELLSKLDALLFSFKGNIEK